MALSEAIARSDRGPLPRLKEMMRNFKVEHVTEEISGALDKMNEEIVRSSDEPQPKPEAVPWWERLREKKTPERRREELRVKGTVAFFSGIGVTIFLYSLAGAVVLKLPPDTLAKVPFELEPLIHAAWTLGLIPTLAGVGQLCASFFIKSVPRPSLPPVRQQQVVLQPMASAAPAVATSVTEGTTELLGSGQ